MAVLKKNKRIIHERNTEACQPACGLIKTYGLIDEISVGKA